MAEMQEILGIGMTATVYTYGEGLALKVFNDFMDAHAVEKEVENTRVAHGLGFPAPHVHDVITWNGKRAAVMDRVPGASLLQLFLTSPVPDPDLGVLLAELHFRLHSCRTSQMQGQKLEELPSWLAWRIRRAEELSESEKEEIIRLLSAQKTDDRLCHNDFHPDNILQSPSGPVVIDWCDAASGNHWADVARTVMIFENNALPPDTPPEAAERINAARHTLGSAYKAHYRALACVSELPIADWRVIVAASRLFCCSPDEKGYNLNIIRERIGST
jgi:aminoglycoside phosphotransferase (APT) family kinase protein